MIIVIITICGSANQQELTKDLQRNNSRCLLARLLHAIAGDALVLEDGEGQDDEVRMMMLMVRMMMVRMVMVMVMVRMVERMRTMVRMMHGKVSLVQS